MSTNSAHRYSDVSQACPIVFVHGSLSSRRIWAPYSAEFGTRETIAVDLPGYGDEPAWPESAQYQLTDAAMTIQSAMRLVASKQTSWHTRSAQRWHFVTLSIILPGLGV